MTEQENSIRIENLEDQVERHAKQWDERFEAFGDKVGMTMDKITDKMEIVVEKFMERIHMVELSAKDYDKEMSIKVAKIATKVALIVSISMMVGGTIITFVVNNVVAKGHP